MLLTELQAAQARYRRKAMEWQFGDNRRNKRAREQEQASDQAEADGGKRQKPDGGDAQAQAAAGEQVEADGDKR